MRRAWWPAFWALACVGAVVSGPSGEKFEVAKKAVDFAEEAASGHHNATLAHACGLAARFSEALLATSRADPRLREGVDASYRRDPTGSSRNPAFLFAQPCRADTGPTLRTLRGLEYLRTNDYPIMYEVARRCNWHCVRFELVAYREVVPTRVRLHVDKMAELSISTGGMTSAALATA